MEIFFQHLVNGLSLGFIYALVAVGITLIFGLTRLVNFAQGQFLVLGSFLTFSLVSGGVEFWLAVPLATVAVGLCGTITDRTLLRPTLDRPLNGFIISLGLVIALEGAMTEVWSTKTRQVPSPFSGVIELGSVQVSVARMVALGVAATSIAGLFVLLRSTDLGRSMRAVAENREAAALVGVNVGRSISTAFFLGTALAGLGGAFIGTLFPFTPYSGTEYVIKGLAVALIGGLGSVHGALIVGLLLGIVETMGGAYGLGSEWRDGYAYIAMIALLVWRPAGLFGAKREY